MMDFIAQHMDFIVSVAPVILLIYLMTKKKSMPSSIALPLVALVLYLIKVGYMSSDPNVINAEVINGLLKAFTPILIVLGAIFLFKTMEYSGAMDTIRAWLNSVTNNRIAQLMIIGWAFAFMIEGASGFGTPAALAAPILVGLGFRPVKVAILCLIMNSVPVSFGAVGTPTWYGFGSLALTNEAIQSIGIKTALMHAVASLFIPLVALKFVVPWKEIKSNLIFIYLSILACVIPYTIIAIFDYEFPSLAGGMIGLMASAAFAKFGLGLSKSKEVPIEEQPLEKEAAEAPEPEASADIENAKSENSAPSIPAIIMASFPLWGTVLVLVITRIKQLPFKAFLNDGTPFFTEQLGTLGVGWISPSLVIGLKNIFGTDVSWNHKLLYVPSIVPFILISVIAFALFKMSFGNMYKVTKETFTQMQNPILALLGALVFVQLMMTGGDQSVVQIIGKNLAAVMGENWKFAAAPLGAVGSFFSGSATVSNLTFGGIQESISDKVGLKDTSILALQSTGAAMGNMVCIHNIVAVCSVLGLQNEEGNILKRTILGLLAYTAVVTAVSLFL